MPADPVRTRWAAGEPALAAWLALESPAAAAAVAAAGFDAVVIDLQHGHATVQDLPHLLAAIEPTGAFALTRASWNDPAELMRALDLGAGGVICPMVGSRAEAEAFVRACRYPPAGVRSYGPIRDTGRTGHEQRSAAEETTLLLAMIETAEGFDHVDEIAATPGLDGLFVGPADLSLSLGLASFADLTDPTMLDVLDAILAAADRHGIRAGIYAPAPPRAAEMVRRGFTFVACAVDEALLHEAADATVRGLRPPAGSPPTDVTDPS